ncbi:TetR/AcrR family transcriptional regulator [Streptomonospora salina]|uniref:HTH tetR-type domain-containing protein n=1 Tax=Streptomonospora salina TaxID=104205 RepID=A0A841EBX9_9ACTN|nr:TetR/AcrR family transcriptional regulator [Streptomonospora salina]MBB5998518.1 hypothetical protein [Streptomonospora salina]
MSCPAADPDAAPNTRQYRRKLERTRAKLLAAAEGLLDEDLSLSQMTVTAVTDRAGLKSRKTFYRHFPAGVTDLIRTLVEQRSDEMRAVTLPASGEATDAYLRRGVRALLDKWRRHTAVWLATLHLDRIGPEGAALQREWIGILQSWTRTIADSARATHAERGTSAPHNLEERISVWLTGAFYVLAQLFSAEHTAADEEATAIALADNAAAACGLEIRRAAPDD